MIHILATATATAAAADGQPLPLPLPPLFDCCVSKPEPRVRTAHTAAMRHEGTAQVCEGTARAIRALPVIGHGIGGIVIPAKMAHLDKARRWSK